MIDFATTGAQTDRTMGGPTTLMWINPWTTYLAGKGVTFHPSTHVDAIDVAGGKVSGVQIGGATVTTDYYVLAVADRHRDRHDHARARRARSAARDARRADAREARRIG